MWSFFCAGWMWCTTASRYSPLINGCVWLNNKFQLGLRIASCHTSPWMSFGLLSLEWCLKYFDVQYFAPLSWYTDNTGPLVNNWRLACSTSAYRGFLSNLNLHCHWFVNQRVSGFNSLEKSWAIRSIMTLDLACVACRGQKTSFMSLEPVCHLKLSGEPLTQPIHLSERGLPGTFFLTVLATSKDDPQG